MSMQNPDNLDQLSNMSDEEFLSSEWNFDEESEGSDTPQEGGSEEPSLDAEPEDGEEEYEDEGELSEEEPESEEDSEEEEEPQPESEGSAEAELKRLIGSPIKAAGQEITLNNVDEVIRLVQMGMDYSKKTQELAPQRKALQLLENHKLLDSDSLSLMVDVMSGNPEAIRKLMADKQISVDAIDTDEPNQYQPQNHSVTDAEVEFKDVARELNGTPEGKQTLEIVANQWDPMSQQDILKSPSNLRHLAEQVKDGTYDKIMSEVTRRKLLGQIPSTKGTLQAYAEVGRELFTGAATDNQPAPNNTPPPVPKRTATSPSQDGRKRVSKARKTGNRASTPSIEDASQLSDEDFMKLI